MLFLFFEFRISNNFAKLKLNKQLLFIKRITSTNNNNSQSMIRNVNYTKKKKEKTKSCIFFIDVTILNFLQSGEHANKY
jgi:hypothetical protein